MFLYTIASEATSPLLAIVMENLQERASELCFGDMIDIAASTDDKVRNVRMIDPVLRMGGEVGGAVW